MSSIKRIAYLAGVSRGTVDRVLNNRGAVKPETEAKIREIAEALHYSPNRLGKTLALKKKNLKFGYILFGSTTSNPFFEDVVAGIRRKVMELAEYGVTVEVRHAALENPKRQVELMDELVALGIHGLVITPINHPLVAEKILQLRDRGIPVVTVNSDIPDCGRIAYVGSDCIKGGETAAGMMGLITGGKANIGVIIGSELVVGHAERVQGFKNHIARAYPDMRIVGMASNNDDDVESFDVTTKLLSEHPEINALFLAAAGVKGACHALEKLGLCKKLRIVSFDTVPYTCKMVREGVITATLGQQPDVQGYKPLDILLDYLGMDIPPAKEYYYTKIEIWIKENL